MYILSLEIVNACNLNCNYCYLGEKKNKVISVNNALKAIDLAIKEALKQYDKKILIYFIGGEPLLQIELIYELVEYIDCECIKYGLYPEYSTTTNGTLLTDDIIEYFIKKRFYLKVSIDGKKESHDLNRKTYTGQGSYIQIKNALPMLWYYEQMTKKVVTVVMVSTPVTIKHFYENFRHLYELGFRKIETGFNNYEHWHDEDKKILAQEIEQTFVWYYQQLKYGKSLYWKQFEEYLKDYFTKVDFYYCKAGLRTLYVTVEGKYYPCTEQPDMEIGSVDTELNVFKIRKLVYLKETKNTKCLACKYLNHCIARGCIMRNYELYKNFYNPVDINCYLVKIFMKLIENNIEENIKDKYRKYIEEESTIGY